MLAPPPPPKVLLAEADDGDGFCVTVSPPQEVGHDRCFDDYLNARAYGTKSFAEIRQRMKCSRCGAKEAQLTVLSPPGPR